MNPPVAASLMPKELPPPGGSERPQRRRKVYRVDPELKAQIALEALRREAKVSTLALKYQVHPNQIYLWVRQLIRGAARVFSDDSGAPGKDNELRELYAKIGQLMMERDFLSRSRKKTDQDK